MANINLFLNKEKGGVIGKAECGKNLLDGLLSLLDNFGMINPSGIRFSANKGVRITKKGNRYTLLLLNFTPPVKVTWSKPITSSELEKLILEAVGKSNSICYLNTVKNTPTQSVLFQLAFSV